ncbi:histidine phosphatase family protein [Corynebacterium hindlerae]|uniref:Histidine phosphatase family protein n=1 Tax=Corynebacterium hindlerae TaxID=699041 RepID=A0A7G5FHY2_9CORY|nr:histidine phosphatase family protein [Corynebacterium hindlerae]QMV86223.1 histidine phosphatase family protein [Corynebacterium hindlerae]
MSTTIVHLLRHGEVYNPDRILYGRLPGYHLSARGNAMAEQVAEALQDHDITYLAASPLQRAQETAAPLSRKLGLDVDIDKGLLEAGNRYEGLRVKSWKSQLWNPVRWPLMKNPSLPSWGEHYSVIEARMMDAIERGRLAAEGHEAVLVSHQLPIVMVQRSVQGKSLAHNPAMRQCELASLTSLVFQGNQITDMYYSEPAQGI